MIYYDSKFLAQHLKIPPAKWKRWVREFLPSDPLSGLQSGVARQFNLKDAFRVYLGGCLVGSLKFTIPETRTILSDLASWLKASGYFSLTADSGNGTSRNDRIYISKKGQNGFGYTIRQGIVPNKQCAEKNDVQIESFRQTLIGTDSDLVAHGGCIIARVVNIGCLYDCFVEKLHNRTA